MRRSIRVIAALGVVGWGCAAEAGGSGYGSGAYAPSDVPVMTAPTGAAGAGGLPMDTTPFAPTSPSDATVGAPIMETPMAPTSGTETPTTAEPPLEPPATEPPTSEPPVTEPPPTVGVPDGEYCASVAGWDPTWAQFEEEVLLLVNENRAAGATCGGEVFPPAPPLTMQESLRCSARLHSTDMGLNDYFDHTSLDGRTPQDRIAAAGYAGAWYGENIAWGQRSPDEVMTGWMESPGHCSNIMNDNFTEIGIGYYQAEADPSLPVWQQAAPLWTQNFGRPGGW